MTKPLWCWLAFFMVVAARPLSAAGEEAVTLLLTANLNGAFSGAVDHQDTDDPMLVMAQSLIRERESAGAGAVLYLDLGNAFYPGLLSRFSYGSVTMDFLDDLGCAATLVSSKDLNIGVHNLEFVSREKSTRLLSANITIDGDPLFPPWFRATLGNKRFTFIGITSENGFFDIAEKHVLGIRLRPAEKALALALERIQDNPGDYIVLLSGRSYADNLSMMEKFPQISLCISGGDTTGDLYTAKAERVDLGEGRSIVSLTKPSRYYRLTLATGPTLSVAGYTNHSPAPAPTSDARYAEFADRLAIWKTQFAAEGEKELVADVCCEADVDAVRVAEVMRHRFGAEVAMLERDAVTPGRISKAFAYLDVMKMVRNGLPVFTFQLTGRELRQISGGSESLVITGKTNDLIQGYPIHDDMFYLVCAPQSVYDRMARRFQRDIPYKNSWQTLPDLITEDLRTDRVIARPDYGFLDDRFRVLMNVYLANFYDRSNVSKGDEIDVPPGKPAGTYQKWGLEDKIDITVYNRRHKFIFSPYVNYIRQDESYFQNLLRGTLFYTYNLNPVAKPYHKTQVDTVIKPVDSLRPVIFRETFGALFETEHATGKIGLGVEKQTQDPEKEVFTGLETILGVKYDLLEYLKYTLDLDVFYSVERLDFENRQIRTEITNAFSFKLNSFLSFSVKYKWFYFYSFEVSEKYRNSQILLSLDLYKDFKFF